MKSQYVCGKKVVKKWSVLVLASMLSIWANSSLAANEAELIKQLGPEQQELLKQLSPEQKRAILESVKSSKKRKNSADRPDFPQVVTPRNTVEKSNKRQGKKDKNKLVQYTLKQFGYDLFAGNPSTFAPATDIPIPADFVIGPGDTVKIHLFGKENREHDLVVNRNGSLNFPGIGPISVAGLSFKEMKNQLHNRIKSNFIGVKSSITMGELRSIRIFVLGDAYKPGSYTVSALSTITNALFYSGGIKRIGSLRNIQLKRAGKTITRLDLYDLLLRGNTRKDVRLRPGDVIFVPPIGRTVGIGGQVRRPAIYEIRNEKTIKDVIQLAGGLLPNAFPQGSQLERVRSNQDRTLIDVNLTRDKGLATRIQNGDIIHVRSVLDKMEDVVSLSGHVQRPGTYQWQANLRLSDLIPNAKDLLPRADLGYVIIKREVLPSRQIRVLSADLEAAWWSKGNGVDVRLQPRDEVMVFGMDDDRSKAIEPVISLLAQQARYGQPEPVVFIDGNVRFPGTYPYQDNMRVSHLIRAAVDVLPRTDLNYTLVIRESEFGTRLDAQSVRLREILKDPGGKQDISLMPRDRILIFNESDSEQRQALLEDIIEQFNKQADLKRPTQVVEIGGFIKAPGSYPLEQGMRISDLIRAGGYMTEAAYTLGAEITRYAIKEGKFREVAHIQVDLPNALNGKKEADLVLKAHDHLTIKRIPSWKNNRKVEILGEVRFPGIYPISKGETLSQLLQRAGGVNQFAYIEGAVFSREDLKERERKQLQRFIDKLEAQIASMALTQDDSNKTVDEKQAKAMEISQKLVAQAKDTKAIGRLVIDLKKLVSASKRVKKRYDIVLKDGDKLYIPQKSQEVTVIGEVFSPTSHIYERKLRRNDYINLSGGATASADEKRIYVVRANGSVIAGKSGWLWGSANAKIYPGDTIIVPVDTRQVRKLKFWTDITQIVYQLGIAAASWKTVGIF